MADDRKRCKRCKQWYLAVIPRGKSKAPLVGECSTPLCYAVKHYSDEEWELKARMAKARVGVSDIEITYTFDSDDKFVTTAHRIERKPDAFDEEALRRFP